MTFEKIQNHVSLKQILWAVCAFVLPLVAILLPRSMAYLPFVPGILMLIVYAVKGKFDLKAIKGCFVPRQHKLDR